MEQKQTAPPQERKVKLLSKEGEKCLQPIRVHLAGAKEQKLPRKNLKVLGNWVTPDKAKLFCARNWECASQYAGVVTLKPKLAPRCHGPFKVLSTWGVNVKLQLPKTSYIHPVFHSSLVSPYKETPAHGPNFTRPPPEIIQGEDDHYEVESVLQSKVSPNKKGILYLIKWKGYPKSCLPDSQMKHACLLVQHLSWTAFWMLTIWWWLW